MLRSYFENIEYEDPGGKFGHRSSKVDFKIPQLKLIVEVKYVRKRDEFGKIDDEIKKDSIDYVQSTGYKKIIVFINRFNKRLNIWPNQNTTSVSLMHLVRHL
ncbi:MAG: PD-(D/E)XK nuclease domain-containing protein [Nitrosotalea sp.]